MDSVRPFVVAAILVAGLALAVVIRRHGKPSLVIDRRTGALHHRIGAAAYSWGPKYQWGRWVETEIGGPEARIDAAMEAALDAINAGKDRHGITAAAWNAADRWSESAQDAALPDPANVSAQWRMWVKAEIGEIGGSHARIEAAIHAAMRALDAGKGQDEVIAAAKQAAGPKPRRR